MAEEKKENKGKEEKLESEIKKDTKNLTEKAEKAKEKVKEKSATEKKSKKEIKTVLERVYNVPLRKAWLKVPRYRRAKKAVYALRKFIARHMKTDEEKVKVSKWVNEEIWKHGIKNVPHHIKVKTTKDSDGFVKIEVLELPKKAILEEKRKTEAFKKKESKKSFMQKAKEGMKEMREGKTEKEEVVDEKTAETRKQEKEMLKLQKQ